MSNSFKALRIHEEANKQYKTTIETKSIDDLPQGDTLIKVEYSSLNYKDALSASGNKGVTKNYPHTPGIDAAGIIEKSENTKFSKGDRVVVTGFDLGMNTWGGYSEYIRVPSDWVLPLPENLSTKGAMTLGTAGMTAGLSISELFLNKIEEDGKVIVSGATGGVGLISLAILASQGFNVTAVTGKKDMHSILTEIGANKIISREELQENATKPLLKGEYSGAIDVAGGKTLDSILKRLKFDGIAICCGLVDSPKLETTVFPFILRGIRLIGIDSAESDLTYREKVWRMFANEWKIKLPGELITECNMETLPSYISQILEGKIKGRIIVKI
ncbi:MAG: YhdH/YhfP family quinone oxidoreductase [Bacteroidota bacterium]